MSSLETKVLGVAEAVEEATLNAPVPTLSEAKPHLDTLAIAIAADVRLQAHARGDFVARVLALRDESDVAAVYDPTGNAVASVNDKIETLCAEVMVAREDTPLMTADILALPSAAPPTIAEIAEAFLPFGVGAPTVQATVQATVAERKLPPPPTYNNNYRLATRDAKIERYKAECFGMSVAQAAEHLGVGERTIGSYRASLAEQGETPPSPHRAMTHNAYNAAQVADRLARVERYKVECHSQGMTTKEAAAHLGVSTASILNYRRVLVATGEARPVELGQTTAFAAAVERYKTECLSQGMGTNEAAAHLGVCRETIRKYHSRLVERGEAKPVSHGGARKEHRAVWQRNVARFVTECRGMTRTEAAVHLGVSKESISRYSKASGVKLTREPSSEVKGRRQRLVNECLPQGMTRLEAAAHLGVNNPQTISNDCAALGIKLRRQPKSADRPEAETKRWLEAAPGLASQGLTKSEAAREVGAAPPAFSMAVNHHLPDLKWKCGTPLNAQDQRFVASVPKLAIAGKTKAGAAVALGMELPAFESKLDALAKYLPTIVWADGENGWSVQH